MTSKEELFAIDGQNWTVRINGDELSIIDPEGRQRHRSKGHMMTGGHLAMALANMPFASNPVIDDALRTQAAEGFFPDPNEPPGRLPEREPPAAEGDADAEWLRLINQLPLAFRGYMEQPKRVYHEFCPGDKKRIDAIAARLESLTAEVERLRKVEKDSEVMFGAGWNEALRAVNGMPHEAAHSQVGKLAADVEALTAESARLRSEYAKLVTSKAELHKAAAMLAHAIATGSKVLEKEAMEAYSALTKEPTDG